MGSQLDLGVSRHLDGVSSGKKHRLHPLAFWSIVSTAGAAGVISDSVVNDVASGVWVNLSVKLVLILANVLCLAMLYCFEVKGR